MGKVVKYQSGKPKANSGRATVMDGWLNILTGIGTQARDKTMGAQVEWNKPIENDLEMLYAGDDVASDIVDTLPDDAFREGIKLDVDPETTRAIDKEIDRLGAMQKLHKAWHLGRLYGGGMLLMIVDDSRDLSQPLDPNSVRAVKGMLALHRFELMPLITDIDTDISSPTFGLPKKYLFYPRRGSALPQEYGQEIHISRFIRFDGAHLPQQRFIQNNYFHDSVLTKVYNPIKNYNTVNDAVALILQEFNQGVFKMRDLADLISQGAEGDKEVQNRLTAINLSRSIARAIIIDKDGEEFENVAAHVTGVPELVKTVANRLVKASKMPHTKILGESPSGLGATGDSEVRDWYDHVAKQQEVYLRPRMRVFFEILLKSRLGPTRGQIPEKWGFTFNPLWQMSDKEQADIRKTQGEVDQIYLQNGVVDPNEIAVSRFSSGKYSTDTHIDIDLRKITPPVAGERVTPIAANVQPGASIDPQVQSAASQKTDSTANVSDDYAYNPEDAAEKESKPNMVIQSLILSKDKFKALTQAKKWISSHEYKTGVDETGSSFRFRQRDPGDFAAGSMRTVEFGPGIKAVMGHLK